MDGAGRDWSRLTTLLLNAEPRRQSFPTGVARLHELAELVRESVVPTADDQRRYVALEHVDSGDIAITRNGVAGTARSSKFSFRRGDVLYGKLRPYLDKAVLAEWEGLASTEFLVLRATAQTDPTFLAFTMHSPAVLRHAVATTAGVNHPRTSWEALSAAEVYAPPLDEQRRIAWILSAIQRTRAASELEWSRSVTVRDVLLRDLLTPTAAWQTYELPEVIDFQEGPGIMARDFRSEGVPLVRLAGLTKASDLLRGCNHLDPDMVDRRWSHFRLQLGDTLLSSSATLGRVSSVGPDAVGAIAYTGIIRMRPQNDTISPSFIPFMLRGPEFQEQAKSAGIGSVMRHFGPSHLRRMEISVPPLAVQGGAISTVSAADALVEAIAKRSQALDRVFEATLKSLLSDRL